MEGDTIINELLEAREAYERRDWALAGTAAPPRSAAACVQRDVSACDLPWQSESPRPLSTSRECPPLREPGGV